MLPRFEIVRRTRPIELVAVIDRHELEPSAVGTPLPSPAPYVAAEVPCDGSADVGIRLGDHVYTARTDGEHVWLDADDGLRSRRLQSRRFGRARDPRRLAISLTGTHLTAWAHEPAPDDGRWVARARYDLRDVLDTRDEELLAGLRVVSGAERVVAGRFGRLGLRDVRLVTRADGRPWIAHDALWVSATAAGPGFFDTAHTSVFRFDRERLTLRHTADLFFRRPDRSGVYGDHATHVVRDGDRWLVATSTWGDFEQPRTRAARRRATTLRVTLAASRCDVLHGTHVLDTEELPLPTHGLGSIATWDPHLVHRDDQWLVGFVSATRLFRFHPALAGGPSLDRLRILGAATDRIASEGTTLVEIEGELRVLASDGRDGRRGHREQFPVFDTAMQQVGALDAPYPTNLPWPSLLRDESSPDGGWLMLCFNGRPHGSRLLGYGTHGDLVVMRSRGHQAIP